VKKVRRRIWLAAGLVLAIVLACTALATLWAYKDIRKLGSGPLWHVPSRFYTSPTRIADGTDIERIGLSSRLKRLRYLPAKRVRVPGEYRSSGETIILYLHGFEYPDQTVKPQLVKLTLEGPMVKDILALEPERRLDHIDLEPESFSEVFDQGREDRTLVTLRQCPKELIDAIIATEDRRFFRNWGIDLRSIFRAGVVNIRSGRIVEGGSTITQQLIKNLFLTSERTYARKIRETWMSLVMDVLFSKSEILEMYINEIYLGQWGNAGVYGFGRAARVYFEKDLSELTLPEAALLAGIIRAPNIYSPYKHPQAALERRNIVLKLMYDEGYITEKAYRKARKASLGMAPYVPRTRHAPYFVDYILASIEDQYPVGVLSRGGYRIFTTLDMQAQLAAKNILAREIRNLDSGGVPLEGAVVIMNPQNGAIMAMVGGKDYADSQFNRAVQMRRQIGSLVKPYVYYTALQNGYVLSSFVDDDPLTLTGQDGKIWTPANYDNLSHGKVMLADALINSYNIATVRLGLDVGIPRIAGTLRSVSPQMKLKEHPSLLLGAVESSPLNVARLFAPFANRGYRVAPFALTAITKDASVRLRGESQAPATVMSADAVYLVDACLEDVMRFGTGKSAGEYGMPDGVCGKTGTTNDMRDSWFVGFTPEMVVAAWVGNDGNKPVNLSGATGAMPIVSRIMASLKPSLKITPPGSIVFCDIDPVNAKLANFMTDKRSLPYIKGSEPKDVSIRIPHIWPGAREDLKEGTDKVLGWFKSLF